MRFQSHGKQRPRAGTSLEVQWSGLPWHFPCNGPGFNPWLRNEDPASSVAQIPQAKRRETITNHTRGCFVREAPERSRHTSPQAAPGSRVQSSPHPHSLIFLRPLEALGTGLREDAPLIAGDSLSPRRWAKERNVPLRFSCLCLHVASRHPLGSPFS